MAESLKIIIDNRYVVPYLKNYNELPWYKKDFIVTLTTVDIKECWRIQLAIFFKNKYLILI